MKNIKDVHTIIIAADTGAKRVFFVGREGQTKVNDPYHCEHKTVELRERTFSNNTTHYVDQCLECGTQLHAHKRYSNRVAQAKLNSNILPFNEQLRHNFFKQGLAERQEQRIDEKAEWDVWYSEYLQSPEWERKRTVVLQRDGYICKGCPDNRRATEVHHLTYAHVGNEFLFELISLCGRCHRRLYNERNVAVRATVPR